MNGTVERAKFRPPRGVGPVGVLLDPLTWRSAVYLLVSFGFGLAYFVGLVVSLSVSLSLVVIWVGIPLIALTMILWRGAAMLERKLAWMAFGTKIPNPYRPMPAGYNLLKKWRVMVADPATWKDLVYLALMFPISLAEFVVSTVAWAVVGSFLFMPLIILGSDGAGIELTFGDSGYLIDRPLYALPAVPVGAVLFVITLYLVRAMGMAHQAYAKVLLAPNEKQELRARAAHLQASRARGVDATEAERRRIERDLHDGAQQQLLAVAMDLGRARAKLEDDPDGAQELIQQAHFGAKDAIVELRNLARGIYPAILTDRGLDAAISAVAARADMPVDVDVEMPDRPPAAVESIAYFIVSEALTNVTKYARATRASVRVGRDQNWVIVEVADNGVGGATAATGGGLAGLADRAATIDGILTIDSPRGGPTVIRADLPCVW